MSRRVRDKIEEVEGYLSDLEEIVPEGFEEYSVNKEKRAACERYFQKIIEAVLDISFIVAKDNNWKIAESDDEALKILSDNGLIKNELYLKLRGAKGMRNFIVHQYDKIEDELVFEAVKGDLGKDIEEFLKKVKGGIR